MKAPAINRELRFLTLTGVGGVELSGDAVIGHFKPKLKEFAAIPDTSLVQVFVNWPDDSNSIVRFTRKYGPLEVLPVPGAPFEFHVDAFRTAQKHFREMWGNLRKHSNLELLTRGASLRFHQGSIIYTAPTLDRYLYVDLATSPVERMRLCKREGCQHPYFIAGHLKQQFCSDECAEEGQRALKREWWDKHGQSWRAKRRTEIKKGVESGSKEAR
jgi:hypothetical protein